MSTTGKNSIEEAEIKEAIKNYPAPAITTTQVGREIGESTQAVDYRLWKMLEKYDHLQTDKMEGKNGARIWWFE